MLSHVCARLLRCHRPDSSSVCAYIRSWSLQQICNTDITYDKSTRSLSWLDRRTMRLGSMMIASMTAHNLLILTYCPTRLPVSIWVRVIAGAHLGTIKQLSSARKRRVVVAWWQSGHRRLRGRISVVQSCDGSRVCRNRWLVTHTPTRSEARIDTQVPENDIPKQQPKTTGRWES